MSRNQTSEAIVNMYVYQISELGLRGAATAALDICDGNAVRSVADDRLWKHIPI